MSAAGCVTYLLYGWLSWRAIATRPLPIPKGEGSGHLSDPGVEGRGTRGGRRNLTPARRRSRGPWLSGGHAGRCLAGAADSERGSLSVIGS